MAEGAISFRCAMVTVWLEVAKGIFPCVSPLVGANMAYLDADGLCATTERFQSGSQAMRASAGSLSSGIRIARDGWRFILPVTALALISFVLSWEVLGGVLLACALATAGFFRDPERAVPGLPGAILAPADGKVIAIDEAVMETAPGRREAVRRVRIFLSIFNVHVQRAPTAGTVSSVEYVPGKFLNALNDRSSDENEHNMIWMQSGSGPIGVRQIAGVIARRVLCTCRPGQRVARGQRIGLIRFGSRTEAYFPLAAQVRARVGDKVGAGLSILAVCPNLSHVKSKDHDRPATALTAGVDRTEVLAEKGLHA